MLHPARLYAKRGGSDEFPRGPQQQLAPGDRNPPSDNDALRIEDIDDADDGSRKCPACPVDDARCDGVPCLGGLRHVP